MRHPSDNDHAAPGTPSRPTTVFAGPGGLPMIEVRNPHATARISLHGAQVLSYRPQGGTDLLFVSEQAVFKSGKAIRGGVPVCWPWFGPDPQGLGRAAHGFARNRPWELRRCATLPGGATLVELGLTDSEQTRALWPHAFDLSLQITVGATLRLALTTRNRGDCAFEVTQALHSYFSVVDIARTRVTGLDGCRYRDKARGAGDGLRTQKGDLSVAAEVDRVYQDVPAELAIEDGAGQRRIRIASEGCRTAVVWNPWIEIAAGMTDLGADACQRFVCVETANTDDEVITLAPGSRHTLLADISLA